MTIGIGIGVLYGGSRPAGGAGGAGGVVQSVRLDGTSDWYEKAAEPTGVADGANGTLSFGVIMEGGDGVVQTFLAVGEYVSAETDYGLLVQRTAANLIRAVGYTSAGVKMFDCISTGNTLTADATKHHVRVQFNDTACTIHLDGTDVSTNTPGTSGSADLTGEWRIGRTDNGAAPEYLNASIGEFWFDDSSITDNDKFWDNTNDLFRSLGSDGSVPLGATPPVYLANTYGAFGTNKGGGGNFTANGAPSSGSSFGVYGAQSVASYAANAIECTRNTDRLDSGANFAADGATVSVSMWLRRNGTLATRQFVWGGLSVRWEVGFDTSNRFAVDWYSPDGSERHRIATAAITDTNWHHVAFSIDANGAGATVSHLYLDGVSDKTVLNDTLTTTLSLNRSYSFGNNQGGTTLGFDGDFAEIWGASEFVDFSTDIGNFISGGKPVDLGSDGSAPTGTQPEIYSKDAAATITTNAGSDVNFTVGAGTFTDAATSPSD